MKVRGYAAQKRTRVIEDDPCDYQSQQREQGPTNYTTAYKRIRNGELGKAFRTSDAALMLGHTFTAEVSLATGTPRRGLADCVMQTPLMH